MATCSSILAWRILWTEEPGRPQSMGSQSDMTEATQHTLTSCPRNRCCKDARRFVRAGVEAHDFKAGLGAGWTGVG